MKNQKNQQIISFRLDEEMLCLLREYSTLKSISTSLAAKQIVASYLTGNVDFLLVNEQLEELHKNLKTVGLDLAFSVKKILEVGGIKVGESDNWVSENVRSLVWNESKES